MFVRYVVRRLAHAVILLGIVSFLCFAFASWTPGSFFDDLRLNPQISPATVKALEVRYGSGAPLATRYGRWLRSAVVGDFGVSVAYQRSAAGLLLPRAGRTLLLTTSALLLTWMVAVPLGLYSSAVPGGYVRKASSAISSVLLIMPELLGCIILLVVCARLGWLPPAGTMWPALIILTAISVPVVFRHTLRAARDAVEHPSIRAAKAHGIAGLRLWFRYVLPLAANPLISLFGLSIGALASASLLVEVVLSWPGLGPLFLEAISSRDLDLITGVALLSACFLAAGNFVGDLLLYAVDPRIRAEAA